MLKEDEFIGSFSLYREEVRPFTDKQIALVQNFAAQAVIAIENARLLNELRERTTDLSRRTNDLTEALEQQTATSGVLEVVSRSAGDLEPVFAAMRCASAASKFGNIYRREGNAMHLMASHNVPPAYAEARRRMVVTTQGGDLLECLLTTKTVVHVADAAAEPSYAERRAQATVLAVELGGVRTTLLVPLLKENELDDRFHEICAHGTGRLLADSSFAVR
jgi:GAF domain-containing protein